MTDQTPPADRHTKYTYNVQYVDFATDEVKQMGEVGADKAVEAFHSFPFREQQKKAETMKRATFPTISYVSEREEATFAVWSLEPNQYEMFMQYDGREAISTTNSIEKVEHSIRTFFSGSHQELLNSLAGPPKNASGGGLWQKIKSLLT